MINDQLIRVNSFILFKIINMMILNKNDVDANAWTRKYFIADSEEYKFFGLEIRGTKLIKLISNPIHVPSQEDDEIDTHVPEINVVKKIIL